MLTKLNWPKVWEITFLIRGFGLSEKMLIGGGFDFSDKGLKSQNLQLRTKKMHVWIFFKYSIYSWNSFYPLHSDNSVYVIS